MSTVGKNILVAPLDWGLGHTTRCTPVVQSLLRTGANVVLAGNERQHAVWSKTFPDLRRVYLEGYNISYSRGGTGLTVKLGVQIPKILKSIQREHTWLQEIIAHEQIAGVISDNRYGLYSNHVPCVFITHQLHIKTPLGWAVERLLQSINYRFINRFDSCWVPDYLTSPGLAGVLSHPYRLPEANTMYVGPLSRFDKCQHQTTQGHLLIMLSGPEPQRTVFEQLVLKQIKGFKATVVIVRGLPERTTLPAVDSNVTIYNYLDSEALQQEICRADYVLCRSGYSSVMDIAMTGAKAIFVPTPGQTEQEYLAEMLMSVGFAPSCSQRAFDLEQMLHKARAYQFKSHPYQPNEKLDEAVRMFLKTCGA
ncbi:MAG: glycosyltransferase [Niabella sp.]